MPSRSRALAVLALISATIVSHEVLLTRLLSVTMWYSLAFAVLSLAMLGLTSGALVAARAAAHDPTPIGRWLSEQMTRMSATLLIATAFTVLVPIGETRFIGSFIGILLVVWVNAVPMVAGASIVARLMSESPVAIGTLYAVDLGAAAAGALAPLVIIGPLTAPSALVALGVLVGAAALLVDRSGPKLVAWGAPAACLVAVLLTQLTPWGLSPRYAKGRPLRESMHATIEEWNPLSYILVSPFEPQKEPVMWGPSPLTPQGSYTASIAMIDGDAFTPIYAYANPADLDFLRYDVTSVSNVLRPTGTACIIGVGGGRDILTALNFGHDHVLGIEINPAMLGLLDRFADTSPVLRDARVETVVGDGRAVLAGSSVRCSVLQASLIDTWAATGAGAFAHTEATLYTREAWSIFLRRVEPNGILTFSRWFSPSRPSETARLVSLGMASLLDRRVATPRNNIAVITSDKVATMLVSPEPFTAEDLSRLDGLEQSMRFKILFSPTRAPADPLLQRLLAVTDVDSLAGAAAGTGLDTSAPTDDRPFFFQLLGIGAWLHPFASIGMLDQAMSGGVAHGNVTAMIEMLLVILAVSVVGAALLGPTFLEARRTRRYALPCWQAGAYFSLLGAGFMLAEIALVQRMHVVLGHPTYALVIVLASLLVASGVGSALSERLLRSRRSVSIAAFVAGLLLMLLPSVVIAPLASRTLEASLAVRASWTGGSAALVGLSLGMFFPSGVRFVSRTAGAPMALALNGVASVIGSAAAVLISVLFSIPASFAVAGLIYVCVGLLGPMRWKEDEEDVAREGSLIATAGEVPLG